MVPIHICKTLSSCHPCTAPSLPTVPRWVAREAGSAGQSCRAGGARATGPAGQSSRAACFLAREAGQARQKLYLAYFVLTYFHTCYHPNEYRLLVLTLLYILFSFGLSPFLLVLKLGAGPHPLITYTRGYGCGCFLKSPLDTVLISTSIP